MRLKDGTKSRNIDESVADLLNALIPNDPDDQITTGHGDFNHKLHGFNLVDDPTCSCGHPCEDARHILEDCPNAHNNRTCLRRTMEQIGFSWPYDNKTYIRNRKSWEALTVFASSYLKKKEEEREILRAQQPLQD